MYIIVELYTRSFLDFIVYPSRDEAVDRNIDLIKTGRYHVIELKPLESL